MTSITNSLDVRNVNMETGLRIARNSFPGVICLAMFATQHDSVFDDVLFAASACFITSILVAATFMNLAAQRKTVKHFVANSAERSRSALALASVSALACIACIAPFSTDAEAGSYGCPEALLLAGALWLARHAWTWLSIACTTVAR